MNELQLKDWFRKEQPTIEKIILEAAKSFVDKHESLPNFAYDLKCAQEEAYNLSGGNDLCYDRYTTPLAYSLWYQGRRINVFLSHFYSNLLEACNSPFPIEIFDLGAGTGCTQFCFGLAYVAHLRSGLTPSLFRLINVDLSPFMLNYLKSYLWPAATKYYPEIKTLPIEYNVYSWSNNSDISVVNPWICASYLFDSSDNEEYLVSNFQELISGFKPSKILMLTSSQQKKVQLIKSLAEKLKEEEFRVIIGKSTEAILQGNLAELDKFRKGLIDKYKLRATANPITWMDTSFIAVGLEKKQTGFSFGSEMLAQSIDLFNPPLKIRRNVQLNPEQTNASKFEERPSVITGPAGCGKSVVVTEKVINIIEKFKEYQSLEILITTFNKGLIKQLRKWITDLLIVRKIEFRQIYYLINNGEDDGTGEIIIGQTFPIKIKFVHFEMLGKYIGGIKYKAFDEKVHVTYFKEIIPNVRAELSLEENSMVDILNPEFLLEEYHRVIYGLGYKISLGEDVYQGLERKGRGKKPQLYFNSQRRKAVWISLHKYVVWMHTDQKADSLSLLGGNYS